MIKKIVIFLFVFVASLNMYAQQNDSVTVGTCKKAASWTISSCYQAEAGFVGSYWKNTFNIARDKNGYYFVFNMYSPTGYYTLRVDETPFVYFKGKNGEIIQLRRDEEPYYTFRLDGYYSSGVYMPPRYVTRFIYDIDDIDDFISHTYVKYRISLGEGYNDVILEGSYSKKFNKRLHDCKEEVDKKYTTKEKVLNNPLEGF